MTNSNIKISIIIPVYNVERYLRQSLDSVVNQTLKETEIICIDDCSTDNSFKILQEYASKDSRFVVLKQDKNSGQGAARNRALDIAKGEYIMFLDPDDWFETNACELCYNQITKNNNDFVIFGHNKYYEALNYNRLSVRKMLKPFNSVIKEQCIKLDDTDTNYVSASFIWSLIYKKELLNNNNIRFSLHRNFEDHVFFNKVIIYADNISIIPDALYNYRVRKNSSTYKYNNQHQAIYETKKLIFDELKKVEISVNKKAAIYVFCILSSLNWYRKYTEIFPKIEKDFYNSVRDVLISADREFIEKEVKQRLDEDIFEQYKYIVDNSYEEYLLNKKEKIQEANNFINYKKVGKYVSRLFPNEEDRNKLMSFCEEIEERKQLLYTQLNYPKIQKRISKKKGKIKILFLVSDLKKWKSQSLYDLMLTCEKFEPVICLHLAEKNPKIETLIKNKDYFESKGINTIIAHDIKKNRAIDLKKYKPDIVFYQQTDYISKNQSPADVSKYALTCYIPDHLNNYKVAITDYNKPFYQYLYRYYYTNKKWKEAFAEVSDLKNLCATGNTMLDYLYLNRDKKPEKNYVIYAPHWSFYHEKNENNLRLGTFLWNGKEILEYAQAHPEINWVFIPNEKLKDSLIKTGFSKEETDKYYSEWEKIAKTCFDGNYTDLFLESKLLITDGDNYLTEYFYSGKPIIHLISPDSRIKTVKFVKKNLNTLYKVHNITEMYETFDRVILNSDDYKYDERMKLVNKQYPADRFAAVNILDNIISSIAV